MAGMVEVVVDGPLLDGSADVERILRTLPDWFGIESSLLEFVADAGRMPTFFARVADEVVGFLMIRQHFQASAEVHVMGVLPAHHRRGIGRVLQRRAEAWLREEGVEYLQVKTVSASSPNPDYALTRSFYVALGFRPLEEMKGLWDATNPCLILVKRL